MPAAMTPTRAPCLMPSSDIRARIPPSPSLSARMTTATYLTDVVMISVHTTSDSMPSASAPRLPCGRPDRWSLDAAALVMDGNALELGSQKAHGSGGMAAGRLIQDFRDGPVRVVSPPTFVS